MVDVDLASGSEVEAVEQALGSELEEIDWASGSEVEEVVPLVRRYETQRGWHLMALPRYGSWKTSVL